MQLGLNEADTLKSSSMLIYSNKEQSIYTQSMENLRVIQVKVVVPEKPLDINTFPKITLMLTLLFTIVSKYLSVYMASCDIQKYFILI
jgi:hypothetical protein